MGDFLIEPPLAAPGPCRAIAGIELKMRISAGNGNASRTTNDSGRNRRRGQATDAAAARSRPTHRNPYLAAASAAAANYQRERHLPPLLALWPQELADFSHAGTMAIVAKLEKALRQERRRREQRHWCYDINRHAALVSALKAERQRLQDLG